MFDMIQTSNLVLKMVDLSDNAVDGLQNISAFRFFIFENFN